MSRRLISQIGLLVAVFFLSVAVQGYASFREPNTTPPNANVNAPLNTGSSAQTKSGDLTVKNLTSVGSIWSTDVVSSGNVFAKNVTATGNVYANGDIYTNGGRIYAAKGVYIKEAGHWKKLAMGNTVNNTNTVAYLYKSQHTTKQCTNLGGTVVTDGSTKFCKFMENYDLGAVTHTNPSIGGTPVNNPPSQQQRNFCTSLGGKVTATQTKAWGFILAGTYYKCVFPHGYSNTSNNQVPAGWAIYRHYPRTARVNGSTGGWSITVPETCHGHDNPSSQCTTKSHSTLQNKGRETCSFYSYIAYQGRGFTDTCQAAVVAVGAY